MKHRGMSLNASVIALVCVSFAAAGALRAATYEVYATAAEAEAAGQSSYGAERIVYLVTNVATTAYITLHKGTYDFAGIICNREAYAADDNTYYVTNHLYIGSDNNYNRIFQAAGDGEVVFKGDGRLLRNTKYKNSKFYGIVFDGFSALGGGPGKGNDQCGGALRGPGVESYAIASNCVFRNCSGTKGGAVAAFQCIDCVFSNNYATIDGGAASTIFNESAKSYSSLIGCRFVGNCAANGGGAVAAPNGKAVITDCWFEDNIATNFGGAIGYPVASVASVVEGCVFLNNAVYGNDCSGGAIGGEYSPDCRVYDCGFTNNFAWRAGAAAFGTYSNCVFKSNYGVEMFAIKGLSLSDAAADFPLSTRVVDSKFIDNYRGDRFGRSYDEVTTGAFIGFAHDVRFENCEITGGDCGFSRCSLDRCNIHDIPGPESGYVFYQENFVSNTLISGCSPDVFCGALLFVHTYAPYVGGSEGLYCSGKVPGEFVNCTVADNEFRWAMLYEQYTLKPAQSFRNCAFFGNAMNGSSCDMKVTCVQTEGNMDVVFSNCAFGCVYGSGDDYDYTASAFTDTNIIPKNPRFIGENQDGVPEYTPLYSSPLFGAGDASFSVGGLDLAGNARLRGDDGKELDIGCYQCWLKPVGLVFVFR